MFFSQRNVQAFHLAKSIFAAFWGSGLRPVINKKLPTLCSLNIISCYLLKSRFCTNDNIGVWVQTSGQKRQLTMGQRWMLKHQQKKKNNVKENENDFFFNGPWLNKHGWVVSGFMYSGFKDLRMFSKETKDAQKLVSTLGKSVKKYRKYTLIKNNPIKLNTAFFSI